MVCRGGAEPRSRAQPHQGGCSGGEGVRGPAVWGLPGDPEPWEAAGAGVDSHMRQGRPLPVAAKGHSWLPAWARSVGCRRVCSPGRGDCSGTGQIRMLMLE